MISIKGRKAKVLAALYNASRPLGLGHLHYRPEEMTEQEAEKVLRNQSHVDYLYGRVMKCNFSGDEMNTWFYNRDNGEGAAEKVVASLRD